MNFNLKRILSALPEWDIVLRELFSVPSSLFLQERFANNGQWTDRHSVNREDQKRPFVRENFKQSNQGEIQSLRNKVKGIFRSIYWMVSILFPGSSLTWKTEMYLIEISCPLAMGLWALISMAKFVSKCRLNKMKKNHKYQGIHSTFQTAFASWFVVIDNRRFENHCVESVTDARVIYPRYQCEKSSAVIPWEEKQRWTTFSAKLFLKHRFELSCVLRAHYVEVTGELRNRTNLLGKTAFSMGAQ